MVRVVRQEDGRSFLCGTEVEGLVGVVGGVLCSFWDGHTDYRAKMTEEEENEKLENFANWIEEGDSDWRVCCGVNLWVEVFLYWVRSL